MQVSISKTVWNNVELKLETGRLAKQADGSVLVSLGETVVLCTAVVANKKESEEDFKDISVFYQERFYAVGKIPGGFVKREGKASDKEVLTSRIIDRSLRPIIHINNDKALQITCTVFSYDGVNLPDVAALIGATAAAKLAGFEFATVVGARLCLQDHKLVINPKYQDVESSKLEIFMSGTADKLVMLECGAPETSSDAILEYIQKGLESLKVPISAIDKLVKKAGVKTLHPYQKTDHSKIIKKLKKSPVFKELQAAFEESEKKVRYNKIEECEEKFKTELTEHKFSVVQDIISELKNSIVRDKIILQGKRIDNRQPDEIRNISCEVAVLPKVHGSAIFNRGETQVLAVVTMGGRQDGQMSEDVTGIKTDKLMLHYNFPGFCVGEIVMPKGVSRRETGHGNLARKAIFPIAESHIQNTVRIVAEVLECNGSSSMASVCASSLALMNAGVQIRKHVAGIAMGLVKHNKDVVVLSDIMGDEDHLGDMDFKVAGTLDGITAMQMDTKIDGIDCDILKKVLEQAEHGLNYIIAKMQSSISKAKHVPKNEAPKSVSIKIDKDQIRTLIGPGGKTVREINSSTKCKIDISEDGTVNITGPSAADTENAIQRINLLLSQFKVGSSYQATVKSITPEGLLVQLSETIHGFIPVSEIAEAYTDSLDLHFKVGQEIKAKVVGFEKNAQVKLTLKIQQPQPENQRVERENDSSDSKPPFKKKRFL